MYGGLLGVGKTTVIRQLLQNGYGAFRIVIIENEIGKVNLDAACLKETGVAVREMTGGCICCSIRGKLREVIIEIVHSFHPDFIVMEPSGAADIRGIQEEIRRIPEVWPGRYVLIVNAKKIRVMLKAAGPFFYDQIRCADTIYLNRADQITEAEEQQVRKILCEINSGVRFVDKPVQSLKLDDFPLMELPETDLYPAKRLDVKSPFMSVGAAAQSSLSVIDLDAPKKLEFNKKEDALYSWYWRLPKVITEEQFSAILTALQDTEHLALWRAKGFAKTEDGVQHKIDYVFEDIFTEKSIQPVSDAESGIVLIGRRIDREFLKNVLTTC